MKHHFVEISVLIYFLIQHVFGYKYLLVGISQVSHIFEITNIGGQLVKHGHEVVLPLPHDYPETAVKIIKEKGIAIWTSNVPKDAKLFYRKEMVAFFESLVTSGDTDMYVSSDVAHKECQYYMEDTTLMTKLKAYNFDMAIVDGFPIARCTPIVPHYLGIPWISETTINEPFITKTPLLPSVFPSLLVESNDDMTFAERCNNLFVNIMFVLKPFLTDDTLIKKYARDQSIKSWDDLGTRAELYIVTRDHLMEYPAPAMPNVIEIGGTTAKPAKPLPKELLSFVEGPTDVVIVSFGSILNKAPKEMNEKFMNVFRKRKEKIIWNFKGEESDLQPIPSNVKLLRWIPQNDLLGHPNVKLFLTHGGNNGRYEAMYHSVPMVAFPIFAEQPHNAKYISSSGIGLQLSIQQFTEEELISAMDEVLRNPKYTKNIQKKSAIMKSRPRTELETAAWWIEHVTKFGGDHLRSHASFMPWYKLYMVDMFLVVLAIVVCMLAFVRILLKVMMNAIMGNSSTRAVKKKQS